MFSLYEPKKYNRFSEVKSIINGLLENIATTNNHLLTNKCHGSNGYGKL